MTDSVHLQVVTSLKVTEEDSITVLCSTTSPQSNGPAQFRIRVPRMDAAFTGTGDLMAALLLAHTCANPASLSTAVEKAVASLQIILKDTLAEAGDAAASTDKTATGARARELRLIQGQAAILHPDVQHRAEGVLA
jgi:pyridoxine kinase